MFLLFVLIFHQSASLGKDRYSPLLLFSQVSADQKSRNMTTLRSHHQKNQFELDGLGLLEKYLKFHHELRNHLFAPLNLILKNQILLIDSSALAFVDLDPAEF